MSEEFGESSEAEDTEDREVVDATEGLRDDLESLATDLRLTLLGPRILRSGAYSHLRPRLVLPQSQHFMFQIMQQARPTALTSESNWASPLGISAWNWRSCRSCAAASVQRH